jgi:uncharacterized membrane protein
MMGFGFIGIILVIGVLALFIGWRPHGDQTIFRGLGSSSQSPREILEARYARGEINKKEFDQIRDDLS